MVATEPRQLNMELPQVLPSTIHCHPPQACFPALSAEATLRSPCLSEHLAGATAARPWCHLALPKLTSTTCSGTAQSECANLCKQTKVRSHLLFPGQVAWSQQFDSKRIGLLWNWPLPPPPREKISKHTEGGNFQLEAQPIVMVRLQAVAFGHKTGLSFKLTCSLLPWPSPLDEWGALYVLPGKLWWCRSPSCLKILIQAWALYLI